MINERALLTALKNDWKGVGYTVGRTGDSLLLDGDYWALCCTMEVLPRKVLALLVEHLGEIPEAGDCWQVSKSAGNQTALLQVRRKEFMDKLDARAEAAAQTKLTFGGWRVWQETQSLKVLLMDEELTSIVVLPQGGEAESWGGGLIKDAGPDVLVVHSKVIPPEAEYLQAVQWK